MISNALHVAINALHQAIADEPDPADKASLSQCLQQMLKVQAKELAETAAGGAQGGGPAGGGGGGNALGVPGRRSALISQLAGAAGGGGF